MAPPQKKSKCEEPTASDPQGTNTTVPAFPHDDHNTNLFNKVFGIDLLREKIIDFAIHNGVNLSRGDAYSCRLVQRSWHESVSKCLIDAGTPLFILTLREKVDLAPTSLVNQFLNAGMSTSRTFPCVPPFSLTIDFCHKGTRRKYKEVLQNFLHYCSSGLLSLDLEFSCLSTLLLESLPHDFSLPVLQKLMIWFTERVCEREAEDATSRFQLMLSATQKLTFLRLIGYGNIPVRFADLRLPATITTLELCGGLTFDHLEELSVCNGIAFQKLTDLTLSIPDELYDGKDSIYQILNRVRHTLKRLTIGGESSGEEGNNTLIHFPTMKNLLSLTTSNVNWEWANDAFKKLERSFPVVKTIDMSDIPPKNLRQLVEWSRFESVEKIYVRDGTAERCQVSEPNEDVTVALLKLPLAFPNVTILDLSTAIGRGQHDIFHSIFQNMAQLQELSVHMVCGTMESAQFWIKMFLGMLPEEINSTNVPYITKLSALRDLSISAVDFNKHKIFLDEMFEYGFLRMPKLLNVELEGIFEVSSEMRERWRQEGRKKIIVGYR